jgi:hypothetical protein
MRLLSLSAALFLLHAGSAAAEEVWFAPPDNVDHGARSFNKDFSPAGTGPGKSDADAVAAYKRNMAAVDAARLPLDFVVIANWTPHPANYLPESDPNSLAVVLHYDMTRHWHMN